MLIRGTAKRSHDPAWVYSCSSGIFPREAKVLLKACLLVPYYEVWAQRALAANKKYG